MLLLPGLALAAALGVLATVAAAYIPLVGAPVLAILTGAIVRAAADPGPRFAAGLRFAARSVLQGAIVLSGFALSLLAVARTGLATLPLTLVTVGVALVAAALLGPVLRVSGVQRLLIGVGTAICGASAIAAVASVVDPPEADLALSVATIFLYNVVAVLLFPALGHLLHLTQSAFGTWAGTAINDTSSVVAAGYAYGHEAGVQATIVKLTRATLILPIVAVIALVRVRRLRGGPMRPPWRSVVPWFIVWFLAAAAVNTVGAVPATWHGPIAAVASFAIAVALAAIGLQTDLRRLLRTGGRPLALGLVLWALVAVASLAIQRASGI